MGFINKIEQSLEKAVRGTFSKGGSSFEPVDLANRIRTDMDDESYAISSGRTIAPNVFTIGFSADDFPRVQNWGAPLAEELCDVVIRHARTQGYSLRGSVRVTFSVDDAVEPGDFEVRSAQEKVAAPAQAARPGPQHSGYRRPSPAETAHPGPHGAPVAGATAAGTAGSGGVGAAPRQSAYTTTPGRIGEAQTRASRQPNRQSHTDFLDAPTQVSPQIAPRHAQYADPEPQVVLEINGKNYSINSLPVVLGRGSNADITVEDTGVSRRHLEIMEQDGSYLAVDLGSTNGSYLNGSRLSGRRKLSNGSVLSIGRAHIVFHLMSAGSER